MTHRTLLCLLAVATLAAHVAHAAVEADRIITLPGEPTTPARSFEMYSGYLTIDADSGKRFFYVYVESDSRSRDLVQWMNGGPGCSSVGGGLMTEMGPFIPQADGSLKVNPYSWNKEANMLYIETPAGVGFSYSDSVSDYTTNDAQTAADNYVALQAFFEGFPELRSYDFYVTGESYAGHYIPQLVEQIVTHNSAGQQPTINLKGFAIGNAYSVPEDDVETIRMWAARNMLSQPNYKAAQHECNDNMACMWVSSPSDTLFGDCPWSCLNATDALWQELGWVNIYNVYADACPANVNFGQRDDDDEEDDDDDDDDDASSSAIALQRQRRMLAGERLALHRSGWRRRGNLFSDCVDDYAQSYLNTPAVQQALHARPMNWSDCDQPSGYNLHPLNYTFSRASQVPVYQRIFAATSDLRVLIYSGNADSCVPFTGSMMWVDSLNLPVVGPWRAWTDTNGQLAGYVEDYQGLSFLTVKGAGHMVPQVRPSQALTMFRRFLNGDRY